MEIATYCRGVAESGELFEGGDYVGENYACDVKIREVGLGDGETVYDSCTAVMANEHGLDGRVVSGVKGFYYGGAVCELIVVGGGRAGVAVTRKLWRTVN